MSVPLTIIVGSVPNSPSNITVVERFNETAVEISWTADIYIIDNQLTNYYSVYVDDLSGNVINPI